MMFDVSCNHSLKRSQIETKRAGKKRRAQSVGRRE